MEDNLIVVKIPPGLPESMPAEVAKILNNTSLTKTYQIMVVPRDWKVVIGSKAKEEIEILHEQLHFWMLPLESLSLST